MLVSLICIGICIIFIIIVNTIKYNKQLVKFYQIWLKNKSNTSSAFIVMSGIEKRNKLISHNGIVFKKSDYVYAVLPFFNLKFTYKDLKALNELEYLEMCLKLSKEIDD